MAPKVLTCATGRTSSCGPGRDIWGFTDRREHRRVPMMHTDGHDSHVLVRAARKPTTTKNYHFEYDFRSADLKWTEGTCFLESKGRSFWSFGIERGFEISHFGFLGFGAK